MRTPLLAAASLGLLLLLPSAADAGRHHARAHAHGKHRHAPKVRVVVKSRPRAVAPQACPGAGTYWVPGHPGVGGIWVAGHCAHVGAPPRSGWVYVSGYWNGAVWVTGFWRPSVRVGFTWVDGHVNEEDEYIAGYWEPEGQAPEDMMWRPGYYDGSDWVAGGWVPTESYEAYDENGELAFFAVGDGHVEELAIPALEEGALDSPEPDAQERHASVPD
jgi:hypothetical protein